MNENGQAILELLCMLLALTVLILALIVLAGLESVNNRALLEAKQSAENSAFDGTVSSSAGNEIREWRYADVSLYGSEKITIPFTANDVVSSSGASASSIGQTAGELNARFRSEAENYEYSWRSLSGFGVEASAVENIGGFNAYDAAGLVVGDPESFRSLDLVSASGEAELSAVWKKLFGRMAEPAKNTSNRVYMPQMELNED